MEGTRNIKFFSTPVEEEPFVRRPGGDAKWILDYVSLELRQQAWLHTQNLWLIRTVIVCKS